MSNIYSIFVKRVLDILISFVALLVLWPVLLIVGVLVRIKLGSPVLHTKKRPGKNEKLFKLYKFRTMTDEVDNNGELLPDSERLISFGKALRSTSLDELPELWNILKGDMSFVGPRPLATQYLPFYNEEERKRHSIRPGLTGLAQVSGRNSLSWEERFEYDIQYAESISLLLDIKILFKTVKNVLAKEDIGERGKDGLIDFDEYRKSQSRGEK